MRIDTCSSCKAPIVWAETPTGKLAPFDAEPSWKGRWGLDDRSNPPKAAKVDSTSPQASPGFVSHFSTCPQAAEHRRRR